jgi:hypothetical protein
MEEEIPGGDNGWRADSFPAPLDAVHHCLEAGEIEQVGTVEIVVWARQELGDVMGSTA